MPPEELEKILEELAKTNPDLLKKINEVAVSAIKQDKVQLFNFFFKRKDVDWNKVKEILHGHENNRLDVVFDVAKAKFKISLSYRDLKIHTEDVKEVGSDNGTGN